MAGAGTPAPVEDWAARGEAQAKKDLAEGTVQTLEFGEDVPDDYIDPKTKLPGGSMGCEPSDDEALFRDAYNAVVLQYVKDTPPFPDDLVVEWTVADESEDPGHVLRVTASGATLDGKGVPTVLKDRLRVGVLSQSLFGLSVGPRQRQGTIVRTLSLQRGSRHWMANWGDEGPIAPQALVDVLERWRAAHEQVAPVR